MVKITTKLQNFTLSVWAEFLRVQLFRFDFLKNEIYGNSALFFLFIEKFISSCKLVMKLELNHRNENISLKCSKFMTYSRKILF